MNDYDNVNLEFKNAEFHEGLNVTVRLGNKWMNRVDIGDHVWLVDVDNNPSNTIVGLGIIKGKMEVPFLYIPEDILRHQHDLSCRTMGGLYRMMLKLYKDKFNQDSICTVLLFEVK